MTNRRALAVSLLVLAIAGPLAGPAPGGPSPTVAAAQHQKLKNRKRIRALLRKGGLASLPSAAQAIVSQGDAQAFRPAAVVGTPPTLVSIPTLSVADLFWQPGVLDAIIGGTPSPEQCGQFYAGSQDGDSGGLGACHMAAGLGYSLGDILSGETSLCYMKTFPTADNIAAGAVVLVDGAFPGDDPTRLFSVPGGARSRVVKVDVSGQENGSQTVFIRVYGAAQNRTADDLYAVDLWFCPAGADAPRGYDRIRIGTSGEYSYDGASTEQYESHTSTVSAFVSFEDGRIAFDTTRGRHAATASSRAEGSFKADHTIDPDDTIASKSLSTYGGGSNRGYVVSSFTGTSTDTLRFLAGAFKEASTSPNGDGSFAGSSEFRSTYYAASPGSALEVRLADVDLAGDDFYATPASPTVDTSGYSCAEAADVEVAIDFTHPVAQAVQAACEHRIWEQMNFCWEDPTIQAAQSAYWSSCTGPH